MTKGCKAALPILVILSFLLVVSGAFAFSQANPNPDYSVSTAVNSTLIEIDDLDRDGLSEILVNSIHWTSPEARDLRKMGHSQISVYSLTNNGPTPKAIFGLPTGNFDFDPFGIAVGNMDRSDPGEDIGVVVELWGAMRVSVLSSPIWTS
ncbi:MAG: hypothetical protein ABIF92_01195, partial [archaeon]